MEAVILRRGALDQSISPRKSQIGNPNKNIDTIGLLQTPPPASILFYSYPHHSLRQPPLLPLPAAHHRLGGPANRKTSNCNNRTRDPYLTPVKNKSPKKVSDRVSGSPKTGRSGPDPKSVDVFSGSATFTMSPPPSSLPLPTFSLRPKLSCGAEISAGIDAGATDDLRRLLRLR